MADSTADATAANAYALSQGIKKVLTETFYDGVVKDGGETEGSSGGLKSIDDTVTRIFTCLSKVVSETTEVPKEFICTLSNKIMIEPVIIASGQTYEKSHITDWLKDNRTCPKTKQVLLSNFFLTPNHLINELITQWCLASEYDRPKPDVETVIELFTPDIESLLHRISSPSSASDQIEAAKELCRQTKKFVNVRILFVTQIHGSITRLLTPLLILGDDVNASPELQENIITSLFNMSTVETNKTVISEHPHVIPLLAKSLKKGTTVQTQKISAATLTSLSAVDSNKILIGDSEALKALVDLMNESDDLSATGEAAYAVFNLCREVENREKVISAGMIPVIIKKIRAKQNKDEMVSVFASLSTSDRIMEEIEESAIIIELVWILTESSCSITIENVLTILLNMCEGFSDKSKIDTLHEEEFYGSKIFTKLAKEGSELAKIKAERILGWIQRYVDENTPEDAMA